MRKHNLSTASILAATAVFLGASFADAQVSFTKLPTRIEEVLVEPDLGAVLRGDIDLPARSQVARNGTLNQTTPLGSMTPRDSGISYLGAGNVYFPPSRELDGETDRQSTEAVENSESLESPRVAQLPSFSLPADENGDATG